MNTDEVLKAIDEAIGQHKGSERELMEQLDTLAEGWRMRLQELEVDEKD